MEQDLVSDRKIEFQTGQVVRLGNPRWFEHTNGNHHCTLNFAEIVLVLSIADTRKFFRSRDSTQAIVFYGERVGLILLSKWVDEVLE